MPVSAWGSAAAGVALLALAGSALAQTRPWIITPTIGVRGTYTDNVTLAAVPARGEFATEVTPAISIHGTGPRFKASLNYEGHVVVYARNSEENRLANSLSAFANLQAVENFFFIDALGNITQNYFSPFGRRPTDITTITDNRIETRTFGISPYVRSELAGYSYEVRNHNTWSTADSGRVSNVHTRQLTGSVASPIRLFGWGVDGSSTRIAYDDPQGQPDQDTSQVRGRLFFQPDPSIRFFASAGRETNNYALEQKRAFHTRGVGALWRPTPRSSAELEVEHRFFGTARLVSLSHRTRLTVWDLSYSNNISNFQQELLRLPPGNTAALLDQIFLARIPDPVARQAAVERFLRTTGTPLSLTNSLAFFTEQVFVEERLQGSFGIIGARNSILFTAFRAESTAVTDPIAAIPAEIFPSAGSRITQRGFGIHASHQFTSVTSVGATANTIFARAVEPAGVDSRNNFLTIALNHALSPKTSTFAGASYTTFESRGEPTSHAKSVFAGLHHRF